MTVCCKLIRRELLSELRFPVGQLHEDAFVTHLLVFAARKVAVCTDRLYYYRYNPNSITRIQWNPKRLTEIEGHKVRLAYLAEHGYQRAYRQELKESVQCTYLQAELVIALRKENREYRKYDRQIAGELRMLLRECRKYGLYRYHKEYRWLYLAACPVRWLYTFFNAVKGTLRPKEK